MGFAAVGTSIRKFIQTSTFETKVGLTIGAAVLLLIAAGFGLYLLNKSVQTKHLVTAIARGDCVAAKTALDRGADPNASVETSFVFSQNGQLVGYEVKVPVLITAIEKGQGSCVFELFKAGADMKAKEPNTGSTPLMVALSITPPNAWIIQTLLTSEAAVNARDNDGETALMIWSRRGEQGVVQTLLESKADVNARNNKGETALMQASESGNLEVVRALLAAHADLDVKRRDGSTALALAGRNGHEDVWQLLKSFGAK